MKHPIIVNINANMRHNQMLQEADTYRRMKRISEQKPIRNYLNKLKDRIRVLKSNSLDESASSPA